VNLFREGDVICGADGVTVPTGKELFSSGGESPRRIGIGTRGANRCGQPGARTLVRIRHQSSDHRIERFFGFP
jgi:hypothetical protein